MSVYSLHNVILNISTNKKPRHNGIAAKENQRKDVGLIDCFCFWRHCDTATNCYIFCHNHLHFCCSLSRVFHSASSAFSMSFTIHTINTFQFVCLGIFINNTKCIAKTLQITIFGLRTRKNMQSEKNKVKTQKIYYKNNGIVHIFISSILRYSFVDGFSVEFFFFGLK